MIDYEYRDLFTSGSKEKRMSIQYGVEQLLNEDLSSDSMELTECLCEEEELRFGCCYASEFKVQALNYGIDLTGREITVQMELAGADLPFPVGKYIVYTDQESTDGQYRNIVAYDALYEIHSKNMADWYNDLSFPMTLLQFRNYFFSYLGLAQEPMELINDDMQVEKTIDPSEISGKDIITAICEINGCFGKINRLGRFQYVVLQENLDGLYPADDLYPAEDLFPQEKNFEEIDGNRYFSCIYDKFVSKRITKLQIRQEEYDVGVTVGDGDNGYVIEDNFLVYGKGTEELSDIASRLLTVISKVTYQPYTLETTGDPSVETGDPIRIYTDDGVIVSYVFKRVLKGVQMLDDTLSAAGKEQYSENANLPRKQIKQLKGKTNKIEHTLEMTRLEISDLEKEMSSRITQTAEKISLEVTRAQTAEEELSGNISTVNTTLSSRITQTAEQISLEVTRAQAAEEELYGNISTVNTTLSSRITQTAEQISAEATRAKGQEVELAAAISINADNISLKVSKGNISSEISQEAGKIAIKSNRFSLESTNCIITEEGKITAKSIDITGGSVKITTDSTAYDVIRLQRSQTAYCGMDSYGFRIAESSSRFSVLDAYGLSVYGISDVVKIASDGIYTNVIRAYTTTGTIAVKNKMQFAEAVEFASTGLFSGNVEMSGGTVKIKSIEVDTSSVKIGNNVTTLSFFGGSGSLKKTVAKALTGSTVTAADVATAVNNLIDALKAYSLIG